MLVDVPVGHPVGLVKHCSVRHGVEERPEGGIAAAVIVELEVLAEIRLSYQGGEVSVRSHLVSQMDGNHLTTEEAGRGGVITWLRLRYGAVLG